MLLKPMQMLLTVAMAAAVCAAPEVSAQAFPAKTVRLLVPQAPGGASDALARIIGQRLSERWHQPVVVENRAGAGGVIGTDVVAKATPDGYTLLLAYDGTHAVNASLYKSLPFDPIKDFVAVATLANVPFVLAVSASSPAKDLNGFIALAKASPGNLSYGSAGNGSVNHLLGAMFSKAAGVQLIHVPYKGAAPAIADLMGGSVDAVFTSIPSVVSYVQSGRLRALAVTSTNRSAALPNVPTIAESGIPGFDVAPWFGILAPAGTPPDIVQHINDDVVALLKSREVVDAFAAQGAEPYSTTPAAFAAVLRRDVEKWAVVVKDSGATVD
jgi:tripartite-type tricarboxylate transporter receptor subunit TctC